MLCWLIWNPDRDIFVIPYINHPASWYGFLFALGFFVGFFLIRKMFADFLKDEVQQESVVRLDAVHLTDRLAFLVVLFGVVGARLAHVFFYDWHYYKVHPLTILKVWEGGLASHGGAVGIVIAILLFVYLSRKNWPKITFLSVLDALVLPASFAGGCIRIGNFINQEITGMPTSLPWGVIFLHPLDGIAGVPLHPVQLYEAICYFFIFLFLGYLWLRNKQGLGRGVLSGWFFLLVFGSRFVLEFFKMPQNKEFDAVHSLNMGQWLSLPFILIGILLLFLYAKRRRGAVQ